MALIQEKTTLHTVRGLQLIQVDTPEYKIREWYVLDHNAKETPDDEPETHSFCTFEGATNFMLKTLAVNENLGDL